MRFAFIIVLTSVSSFYCFGQHTFKTVIKDAETREPLPGATAIIVGTAIGATSDAEGVVELRNIPDGRQIVEVSFLGYVTESIPLTFPLGANAPSDVFLEAAHEELEEVVISTTRGSRTVADIPTRVELIAGEELDEKSNMKPGDIRMLLNESTGIQTQQTCQSGLPASTYGRTIFQKQRVRRLRCVIMTKRLSVPLFRIT